MAHKENAAGMAEGAAGKARKNDDGAIAARGSDRPNRTGVKHSNGAGRSNGPGVARGPAGRRGEVRERLTEAARGLFTSRQFSEVTVRDIAREAQCDPGLINYYFGSKVGLFRAAMSLPADPARVIREAFGDGGLGAGERVANAVLELWERSTAQSYIHVFVSSLLGSSATFEVFSAWVETNFLRPLAHLLPGPNSLLRMEMAFGQIIGLVAVRYVYQREPLASLPRTEAARAYGPLLDITFYGTLPAHR